MLAGGRNSRCNSLDYLLLGFFLCARFFLVCPHPKCSDALVFRDVAHLASLFDHALVCPVSLTVKFLK